MRAQGTRYLLFLTMLFLSVTPKILQGASELRDDSSIEAGRKFWSFQPLSNAQPPQVVNREWIGAPLDRFILARLEECGLVAGRMADSRTLIRRAYFDLLGLPPPLKEVRSFVMQSRRDPHVAFHNLVDRLLASQHYGERWARHWLDVARFAESDGFEKDRDRPDAYHYRDFVIKVLNRDLPYDQFVSWQIAGDQLAPEDPLARSATGFLVAGVENIVQTQKEFERDRYDKLDDMVSTLGKAMLGLTIGCARCHDHKYDPLAQLDYYRLVSAFAKTVSRSVPLSDAKDSPTAYLAVDLGGRWSDPGKEPVIVSLENEKFVLEPKVYFLHRGNVSNKGDLVTQGFPQLLMRGQTESRWFAHEDDISPRVTLTRWITDVDHGAGNLLARVMVNRVWQHHFGRGLVETATDFGSRGGRPSHPALLDWLAREFIRNGWRLKPLHRLIMTSSVYMQSYRPSANAARIDPANRLLWRRPLRRLDSEVIRDSMLTISGTLDPQMYGSGTLDEGSRRRSIYLTVKRSKLIPTLQLFDTPDPLQCVGSRQTTTVAPQALMLLNDERVHKYAQSFANRIAGCSARHGDESIREGFMIALARPPHEHELNKMKSMIERQQELYAQHETEEDAQRRALSDVCHLLMCLNEFVYVE